ncbi:hypothetical protein [Sphingomonas sp. CARO-RG-8B-R24-01]|uniref:hypothetical protein n=1 Tax=Sphingomonas sp. CARO-RG-8B-R24-01 TaxID=2914831 RepID=UPI001F5AADBE|nr:hypothetical protein [Sphingomonas sp. CARO-RG-8B-R24-01]
MDEYIALVDAVYKNTGGIEGQRGPLKTKTSITIRNRLVADIRDGAVMPPVVLGVLLNQNRYLDAESSKDLISFMDVVKDHQDDGISIIDGMQRTTAMLDAIRADTGISALPIRVEFWVSTKLNSLIYRMLVLNTGQVPWEIGRQLETIYSQFLVKIRSELGSDVEVFLLEAQRRRVQAGQYQSKNIVELLLLFSSRRTELDIKDKVAEDFTRLDAIETTAHSEFLDYFIETLRQMSALDRQFARLTVAQSPNMRFRIGKDVFSSFPAMAGFCAAVAIEVFDEPGFNIDWAASKEKMDAMVQAVRHLEHKLAAMDEGQLAQFLQLQLVEERLTQRSGQVGRFEREFFRKAFTTMFRNSNRLENMVPCWMA